MMKNLFSLLFIAAFISFMGCKKILIKPLPTLLKFGSVYEGVYTNPLEGVTITRAVCSGFGSTRSCEHKQSMVTDFSGSFEYPEDVNELVFTKTGYKTTYVDLRATLPPNVIYSNDKLGVSMEK